MVLLVMKKTRFSYAAKLRLHFLRQHCKTLLKAHKTQRRSEIEQNIQRRTDIAKQSYHNYKTENQTSFYTIHEHHSILFHRRAVTLNCCKFGPSFHYYEKAVTQV